MSFAFKGTFKKWMFAQLSPSDLDPEVIEKGTGDRDIIDYGTEDGDGVMSIRCTFDKDAPLTLHNIVVHWANPTWTPSQVVKQLVAEIT